MTAGVTPILRQLHDVKCHETMRSDRVLVFKLVRMHDNHGPFKHNKLIIQSSVTIIYSM